MTCLTLPVECGGPGAVSPAPDLPDNLYGGAEVSERTCSIDGCDYPVYGHGLCEAHCYRRRKGMDLTAPLVRKPRGTPVQRLLRKATWGDYFRGSRCLVVPPTQANGYATIGVGSSRQMAHRLMYEAWVGPIPEGLQIDHLCRVRNCVNPLHLEPVTLLENLRRGNGFGSVNSRKTHCPKGHPYDYVDPTHGWRQCTTCGRERRRARDLPEVEAG